MRREVIVADKPQPYDQAEPKRRTPVTDDIAPEGMDSDAEGDELEASTAGGPDDELDDGERDDHVEPDGVRENSSKP
jgi:hypothetical protein